MGLDPGTYYSFRVRAANAVGWGPFSGTSIVVKTDDAPFLAGARGKGFSSVAVV